MIRIQEIAVVAAVLAGLYWAYAWYTQPPEIPAGITVEATVAEEVKHEAPVEIIKPPQVKAYKAAVKRSLKLPENITNDKEQHVIASSKTANDERPHTITTVINQHTGEVQTFDRADPLPWFDVKTKSEIGVFYGMKSGEPTVRIEGRQELLQVKAVHMGATASADMTRAGADGFIGVGMWARF